MRRWEWYSPEIRACLSGQTFRTRKISPAFRIRLGPHGKRQNQPSRRYRSFYDILKGEDNLQFNGQPPFVSNAGFYFDDVPTHHNGPIGYMEQPFLSAGVTNTFPSTPPAANIDFTPFLPINSTGFVYLVDPHLRTPYVYQYNLSLQRNLTADTVLETNYVGSSGHGLTSLKDINPTVLGSYNRQLDASCPGCFGQLPEFQNVSNANYNALEASLTRQPKASPLGTVYFTFAYTYAHNLDNASGFAQRNGTIPLTTPMWTMLPAIAMSRHRISFSGGWDLPFDRVWASGPKRLTQGWSLYPILTWRTGFPYDISAQLPDSIDPANPGSSGAGDPYLSHAAIVGPIQTYDPKQVRTINEITYNSVQVPNHPHEYNCVITTTPVTGHFIFNPNSFSNVPLENNDYYDEGVPNACFPQLDPVNNPADRTYGLHRNALRGLGLTNLDIAIAKTTSITERVKLELRVEYFNALNHPEFAQPTLGMMPPTSTARSLGKSPQPELFRTAGPRIGQLGARLTF